MKKIPYESSRLKKKVNCICPCCGISHHKRLFWTGKEPARKFCTQCKPDEYESEYSLNLYQAVK